MLSAEEQPNGRNSEGFSDTTLVGCAKNYLIKFVPLQHFNEIIFISIHKSERT